MKRKIIFDIETMGNEYIIKSEGKLPKFRIPRKAKKKIPKGMYCYTPIKFHDNGWYEIKVCEFYRNIPDESHLYGMCSLLNCEIEDQCKSCGTKFDY